MLRVYGDRDEGECIITTRYESPCSLLPILSVPIEQFNEVVLGKYSLCSIKNLEVK